MKASEEILSRKLSCNDDLMQPAPCDKAFAAQILYDRNVLVADVPVNPQAHAADYDVSSPSRTFPSTLRIKKEELPTCRSLSKTFDSLAIAMTPKERETPGESELRREKDKNDEDSDSHQPAYLSAYAQFEVAVVTADLVHMTRNVAYPAAQIRCNTFNRHEASEEDDDVMHRDKAVGPDAPKSDDVKRFDNRVLLSHDDSPDVETQYVDNNEGLSMNGGEQDVCLCVHVPVY